MLNAVLMLSCSARMDCMLHITICNYTREGHLRVAKPEDLGTPSVSCRNGLNVDCDVRTWEALRCPTEIILG